MPAPVKEERQSGGSLEKEELTEKKYWDSRWEKVKLPTELTDENAGNVTKELIQVINRYLPEKEGLSILEIGGAPGQWLAYFAKKYRYTIHALDYSKIGCEKIRENFDLLDLDATIYNRDIFSDDLSDLPRFDVVYSLGFIEHFSDLDLVVERHLALLKDGGILMLGVPNFLGISEPVLRRLAPHTISMHNLLTMDIDNWRPFEEKYHLDVLFRDYTGGFEAGNFRRCEERTITNLAIRFFFKLVRISFGRIRSLRRFNSRYWSAYLLGIYVKK
jgi:SAM-dependent methyltransferase